MRLPDLAPEDLDPEQRALYDAIVGGPRGTGTQHFPLTTRQGALTGPFGVMVHGPVLGRPLQELGSALRHETGLSDRVREVAILTVAAATRSEFERYAHERVGRAALPQASPGIYLTASLGITFPFNILLGLPLYYQFARWLQA